MRTKAKILKVGTVEQREDGLTVFRDWHMDFADCDAALRAEPVQRDEDGVVTVIGNYTLNELRVIAAEHHVPIGSEPAVMGAGEDSAEGMFPDPPSLSLNGLDLTEAVSEAIEREEAVMVGKKTTTGARALGVVSLLLCAASSPIWLGLAAGLACGAFWRAFRWVQGW